MYEFDNVSPRIFSLSAFLIAFVLIDDLSANAQNALGGWFMLLGQTLETNSAQQMYIESKINTNKTNINSKEVKNFYNPWIYDIPTLKKVVKTTHSKDTHNFIEMLELTINAMQKEIKEIKKILEDLNK